MWGNWLGWAISGVISLVAVFFGYQLYAVGQPTLATGWGPATLRPPAMADAAVKVLPPMTDTHTDAAELMRDAVADYTAHPKAYDAWKDAKRWDKAAADGLPGFDDLVRAAKCPRGNLFAADPKELVGYGGSVDLLVGLTGSHDENVNGLATDLEAAAVAAEIDGDLATARTYGVALLAAGLHLYQERLTLDELMTGQDLMAHRNALLDAVDRKEPNAADKAAQAAFHDQLVAEVTGVTRPAYAVFRGFVNAQAFGSHVGDFVAIAKDGSADRVWRIEAVRSLGRITKNGLKAADGRRAEQVAKEVAADPAADPMLRLAADDAAHITSHDFRASR